MMVSRNAICSYFTQIKKGKLFGRRLAGHYDQISKLYPRNYKGRYPASAPERVTLCFIRPVTVDVNPKFRLAAMIGKSPPSSLASDYHR